MALVVDASVAVEYLLGTKLGRAVAPRLSRESLVAPELLDAEVLSVLRRATLSGRLPQRRAAHALRDLTDWGLRRVPHAPLLGVAWTHRDNVSGYDALYVATAQVFEATLLTADGPLARAASLGVAVENVRI